MDLTKDYKYNGLRSCYHVQCCHFWERQRKRRK